MTVVSADNEELEASPVQLGNVVAKIVSNLEEDETLLIPTRSLALGHGNELFLVSVGKSKF